MPKSTYQPFFLICTWVSHLDGSLILFWSAKLEKSRVLLGSWSVSLVSFLYVFGPLELFPLPFGTLCGNFGTLCGNFGTFCGDFGTFFGSFGTFCGHFGTFFGILGLSSDILGLFSVSPLLGLFSGNPLKGFLASLLGFRITAYRIFPKSGCLYQNNDRVFC